MQTSKHRSPRLWLLTGLGLLGFYAGAQSCAPEPRYKKLKVGETITIMPSKPEESLSLKAQSRRVLRLSVKWGERPLSSEIGDVSLRFFDAAGKLRYETSWSRLSKAYRETGCSPSEVAYLDGYLVGEALICDGSLDLKEIALIEGVLPNAPVRRATSWGWYAIGPDAAGVSLGLFP